MPDNKKLKSKTGKPTRIVEGAKLIIHVVDGKKKPVDGVKVIAQRIDGKARYETVTDTLVKHPKYLKFKGEIKGVAYFSGDVQPGNYGVYLEGWNPDMQAVPVNVVRDDSKHNRRKPHTTLTYKRNPIPALEKGIAHYLMISSVDNANGDNGKYPADYPVYKRHLIEVANDRDKIKDLLSLITHEQNIDRTLDLLVINQGHGDLIYGEGYWSEARWTGDDFRDNIVRLLTDNAIKAHIVVLDFCLSAAFLETIIPLCTDDGTIICNLYSTTNIIIDSKMWSTIRNDLGQNRRERIYASIESRMKKLSAELTGHANDPIIGSETEPQITNLLNGKTKFTKDCVSIIRYLPKICDEFTKDVGQNPDYPAIFSKLNIIKSNTNLGANETKLLSSLPAKASDFNGEVYSALKDSLRQRLTDIIQRQEYGINDSRDLSQLPLQGAGENNLRTIIMRQKSKILARAKGLPICPTCFAVYNNMSGSLELDEELIETPLSNQISQYLNIIEFGTADNIPDMIEHVNQINGATVVGHSDFLQNT